MVDTIYILAGALIIVLWAFLTWLYLKYRLKKIDTSVTDNIANSYEYAERRYKEEDGRINQNKILWELASKHFRGTVPELAGGTEQHEVRESIEQREDISSGSSAEPEQNNKRDKRSRWNAI